METTYKVANGYLILVLSIFGEETEFTIGDEGDLWRKKSVLIEQSKSSNPPNDIYDKIGQVDQFITQLNDLNNPQG